MATREEIIKSNSKKELKPFEIRIDNDKLRELVQNNGRNSVVSAAIGRSSTYITKYTTYSTPREIMRKVDYNNIVRLYGVDIAKTEEPKEPKKSVLSEIKEKPLTELTGDEIARLIYSAVYSAVKHAWEND